MLELLILCKLGWVSEGNISVTMTVHGTVDLVSWAFCCVCPSESELNASAADFVPRLKADNIQCSWAAVSSQHTFPM